MQDLVKWIAAFYMVILAVWVFVPILNHVRMNRRIKASKKHYLEHKWVGTTVTMYDPVIDEYSKVEIKRPNESN